MVHEQHRKVLLTASQILVCVFLVIDIFIVVRDQNEMKLYL